MSRISVKTVNIEINAFNICLIKVRGKIRDK